MLTEPVECVHVTQNGIGHFNIPAFVAIGQVMGDACDAINAREVEAFVGVDGDGYGDVDGDGSSDGDVDT